MNDTVSDEISAINAIYGDQTLRPSGDYCVLRMPGREVSIRVRFSEDYPDAAPTILGPEAAGGVSKGRASQVVQLVKDVLDRIFVSGEPCIYGVIEEMIPELQQVASNPHIDEATEKRAEPIHQVCDKQILLSDKTAPAPQWILSEVVVEKKSVFLARAVGITSRDQARHHVQHLVSTDKKASKATHNIVAWRAREEPPSSVVYQDCDDDGESAAGSRLLSLLQLMDVWNVVVVISRWYGGIHLGPDRFRIINQVARDALIQGKFTEQHGQAKQH